MTRVPAVLQDAVACQSGRRCRIVLPTRFDIHETPRFEAAARQAGSRGGVVEIDAGAVRHMDQSAIDALIATRLRCLDLGGDLVLAASSVAARVILELTGRYAALNPIDPVVTVDELPMSEVAA
jgi:anti-anti-sigma regulatory factor